MILKKPYAFLIKNFRSIHIVLSIFIIFVINRFSKVFDFFSTYVRYGAIGSNRVPDVTLANINFLLYGAVILIIVFSISMFFLMRRKDKPIKFYLAASIYYIILFISLIVASNVMSSVGDASLSFRASRVYRDIYLMISIPQFYFVVMSLVRASGFDVKKFNFSRDLEELEIISEDSEEFEFVLGTDSYKQKRKIRRTLREMRYYFLENKLLITGIVLITGVPILIYTIVNFAFINKTYKVGSTGTIGSFTYTLNQAFETIYDYNGNRVKDGKKYIILDMTIANNSRQPAKFENISLHLQQGSEIYYNQPILRNRFFDIGKGYADEEFLPNSTRNLIFVYELSDIKNSKPYNLNIYKGITYKKDVQVYNYAKFKINPIYLDRKEEATERKTNEIINLGSDVFIDSNLVITDISFASSYEYTYQSCNKNDCKEYIDAVRPQNPAMQKLLIISYKLNLNENIGLNENLQTNKDFFDKFLKIEYNYQSKTIVDNLTTRVYPNIENKVFADVSKIISNSNDLSIIINTRSENNFIKVN